MDVAKAPKNKSGEDDWVSLMPDAVGIVYEIVHERVYPVVIDRGEGDRTGVVFHMYGAWSVLTCVCMQAGYGVKVQGLQDTLGKEGMVRADG